MQHQTSTLNGKAAFNGSRHLRLEKKASHDRKSQGHSHDSERQDCCGSLKVNGHNPGCPKTEGRYLQATLNLSVGLKKREIAKAEEHALLLLVNNDDDPEVA